VQADQTALEDVLLEAIRGALAGVHIGFAAKVVSYDKDSQTVCVQPVVKGRLRDEDGVVTTYDLPQLSGVPVEFPSSWFPPPPGKATLPFSITWPLEAGTEGMVRISERSHDEFRATGNERCTAQHPRRFDLSDATFFPCVTSKPAQLPAASVDSVALVICAPAAMGAPPDPTLKLGSSASSEAFVLGTAFAALFNAHTHATPAGPSGPALEGALPNPMGNPASPTGPHLSTKIVGE
jgi:hypothetical protein